jgi:hypothetical protein
MRVLLIVVGVLVALNVVVLLFRPTLGIGRLPHGAMTLSEVKAELERGKSRVASVYTGLSGSPYEDAEYSRMNLRRRTREGMFEVFRAPWSSFCTEDTSGSGTRSVTISIIA